MSEERGVTLIPSETSGNADGTSTPAPSQALAEPTPRPINTVDGDVSITENKDNNGAPFTKSSDAVVAVDAGTPTLSKYLQPITDREFALILVALLLGMLVSALDGTIVSTGTRR